MRIGIVGGGILGLAVGRLAQKRWPDSEITVFEKEDGLAAHQTSHNSGVVHAGIYYQPGSLKARLCRRGVALMRDYCAEQGLPYEECGKLVVAVDEGELPGLDELRRRAIENGVEGVRMLDAAGLRQIEPAAAGIAALHSPRTAITDFGQVAATLGQEILGRGGRVRTATAVDRISSGRHQAALVTTTGEEHRFDRVVVCAGLQSDRLARRAGLDPDPRIIPFRGEYFRLRDERTDLVRGLIYPVPDPSLPFLGVHLTRKIGGEVWIGPNAIPALALEGYRRRDLSPADIGASVGWPGMRSVAWRYRRTGMSELARAASKRLFIRDARRYVPELHAADAVRAPAGIRAQAVDRAGALVDDFRLSRDGNVTWVRNAPSPAATSSLAIAEEILDAT
jgi:L-2-hydroxyglutarate oxidase LhgO